MGAGASAAKPFLSNERLSRVENLDDEFRKYGDTAVRLAWEHQLAKQESSDYEMEMQLAQLRRLASTLTKNTNSTESKARRCVFYKQHRQWTAGNCCVEACIVARGFFIAFLA